MRTDSPQTAYGVDFAPSSCTIVRARKRGRSVLFETLASGRPPGDPSVKALAAAIAEEQQKDRAALALAAPARDSVLRSLATPFASIAKARAVLPSLLDVQLPFPLEQCASQFIVPPQPHATELRATAVALPVERLTERIEQLKQDGFDPDVIDHEAVALWRQATVAEAGRDRVVLYLGEDRTVAVAGSGNEPAAAFSASTAWGNEGDAAGRDKLAVRLRQFIAGAFGPSSGAQPSLLVCGPLARHGAASLMTLLECPPERWRLLEHPESALARSLAAAALASDEWSVNLRTGALEHPGRERRRERSRQRLHAGVRAAALLAIALSFASTTLVTRRHTALQAEVQAQARALTGAAVIPRGQELFIAEQHLAGAAEQFRPFRAWLEPTAYPLFATLMTRARDGAQRLETLSVRADALVIRGSGTDWADPERLAEAVQREGWKVEIERSDAGLDERVHYTVRASR